MFLGSSSHDYRVLGCIWRAQANIPVPAVEMMLTFDSIQRVMLSLSTLLQPLLLEILF